MRIIENKVVKTPYIPYGGWIFLSRVDIPAQRRIITVSHQVWENRQERRRFIGVSDSYSQELTGITVTNPAQTPRKTGSKVIKRTETSLIPDYHRCAQFSIFLLNPAYSQ